MPFSSSYYSYRNTKSFSELVLDYLDNNESLRPFYQHLPTMQGIQASIMSRAQYLTDRNLLHKVLQEQYQHVSTTTKVKVNIDALLSENTFTICTAHQPNIFTGHLYFIYKIIHAIQLAEELNRTMPEHYFVPVYFMGSEDADLQELGEVYVNGKTYHWKTNQKGAVGRMKVDEAFIALINEIGTQLSVESFGNELMELIRSSYQLGVSIEQATFHLVNELFASRGLLVFLPDCTAYKQLFSSVVIKELNESFSQQKITETIQQFPGEYKVQVTGRDINLFYLKDDIRERIDKMGDDFVVSNTNIRFTKEAMIEEVNLYPERFSPNVILRPLFQEMLLPNVAFIGGGGELAYWLELKGLFELQQVPYPVLILRNSFAIVRKKNVELLNKLSLSAEDFFDSADTVFNNKVKAVSSKNLSLGKEKTQLIELYQQMKQVAGSIDTTLSQHAEMLGNKALSRIEQLEKKMLRAEKRKYTDQLNQINKVKNSLYLNGSLQERVENFMGYYAKYGAAFLEELYLHSKGLDQQFCVLCEKG